MVAGRVLVSGMLAVVIFASGCLGPTFLDDDPGDWDLMEPDYELVVEEKEYQASIDGVIASPSPQKITPEWTFVLPEDTESLDLNLSWQVPVNDYTFVLEGPKGEQRHELDFDPEEDSLESESFVFELRHTEPAAGTYTGYVEAAVVVMEDEFSLHAQWAWLKAVYPGGTAGGSAVTLEREGDAWRATLSYASSGTVDDPVSLDLDTFNGRIEVVSTDEAEATVRLQPWGRAATEDRAQELARSVHISMSVEGDTLKAHATKDRSIDTRGSESVGASMRVYLPVAAEGNVKTSNGRIVLDDLVVSDLKAKTSNGRIMATLQTSGSLDLQTSNGRIEADLTGQGDVDLDTSNGRIELDLDPTGAVSLNLDTSNGRVKSQLKESSEIGYELHAKTSNSKISEDMDEASLDGTDKEATLRTSGFDGRSIQVTGDVRTSNGKIEFKGN